jgi:hypothetical protein
MFFEAEHRGEKTREGAKSFVGLLERMKRGRGMKDQGACVSWILLWLDSKTPLPLGGQTVTH